MRTERGERGWRAEEAAAQLLERQGWRVLARNFHCRYGELDVVAQKGGVVAFVEVRMRSTAVWGDPALTVSRAKQQKVVRAALHFLLAHRLPPCVLRFDVVSVVGRGEAAELEHIPDAFEAGQ